MAKPTLSVEVRILDLEETKTLLLTCGKRIATLEDAIEAAIEAGVGCDGKCPPKCRHLDALAELEKALKGGAA